MPASQSPPAFTTDEAIRVLGLPAVEAEGFNDVDFLHLYRAGQDVLVSTDFLCLYRYKEDTAWWDA